MLSLRSVAQRPMEGVSYNRRRVLHDGTVFKGPVLPPGARVVSSGPPDTLLTVCAFTARDDPARIVGSLAHFR